MHKNCSANCTHCNRLIAHCYIRCALLPFAYRAPTPLDLGAIVKRIIAAILIALGLAGAAGAMTATAASAAPVASAPSVLYHT